MATPPVHSDIRVEQLNGTDASTAADFYRRILVPHFRADEMDTEEDFTVSLAQDKTMALAARMADGAMAGGAVADFFPRSSVLLLSYIAVLPAGRGSGIGSILMNGVTEAGNAHYAPALMVMEVEDPQHHSADPSLGDPEARVRFYERLGARTLPVPYFQPSLGAGRERVRNLLLMVFGGSGMPSGAGRVDGTVVEAFLTEFLEHYEGPPRADDAEAQHMLAACRQPGGLPLLVVSELPRPDDGPLG